MELATVHQITENLHKRILALETRMLLGPSVERAQFERRHIEIDPVLMKVNKLLHLVYELFHYDLNNVSRMFQIDPYTSGLNHSPDFIYFLDNPTLYSAFRRNYITFHIDDRQMMIAYIVLQVALINTQTGYDYHGILTEDEIAECIAENVTGMYQTNSGDCEQAIERFLDIIKNAINGDVYDQLFVHFPPIMHNSTEQEQEIFKFLKEKMRSFKNS
jgi:hypothetical protein